jgi:hypothetical protein
MLLFFSASGCTYISQAAPIGSCRHFRQSACSFA